MPSLSLSSPSRQLSGEPRTEPPAPPLPVPPAPPAPDVLDALLEDPEVELDVEITPELLDVLLALAPPAPWFSNELPVTSSPHEAGSATIKTATGASIASAVDVACEGEALRIQTL